MKYMRAQGIGKATKGPMQTSLLFPLVAKVAVGNQEWPWPEFNS